jgi:hypothetical protein
MSYNIIIFAIYWTEISLLANPFSIIEISLKNIGFAGHWWLTPLILTVWEADIGRMQFKAIWANSLHDPISTVAIAKWAGGVAQVTECLLCKHQTVSSNPRPTHKKRNISFKIFQILWHIINLMKLFII